MMWWYVGYYTTAVSNTTEGDAIVFMRQVVVPVNWDIQRVNMFEYTVANKMLQYISRNMQL
jgi:hypothetical protein